MTMPQPTSPAGGTCWRALSPFDIGQAAVVIDGHVVGVEDIEGTDGLLARVARLRGEGRIRAKAPRGVLVKAPKSGQDLRFDLPTIGPRTVEGAVEAGLAGHCHRRRPYHRRRTAGDDRGRRRGGPVRDGAVRVIPRASNPRRAKDIPDRDGGIRRPARRQPDEGAAPAARRRGPVRGRRRPGDGARGAGVVVSDRGIVDHGTRGGGEAAADDPAAHQRDRRAR